MRSLGIRDTITESIPKLNGKEYNKCYTHYLKVPNDLQFYTSKKHIDRFKCRQNEPVRNIVSIEYIGKEECQCIMVDHPDHTYISDDFIPTHNTTSARIFANMINKGEGNPIEMDAASNNGVDDVRAIIQQAKSKSLDSEYKIFIVDECHMISTAGWNAFLKVIEEPPAKSIFIFCTTDPQKIPTTILSRVQRYDFQNISRKGLFERLCYIIDEENIEGANITYTDEALEYICKLASGGMRDAITQLDKCISYSNNITLDSVIQCLGAVNYDTQFELLYCMLNNDAKGIVECVEGVFADGKDLKQFMKSYLTFILDINKYAVCPNFNYIDIPPTDEYKKKLDEMDGEDYDKCIAILDTVVNINTAIAYETYPKPLIEALLLKGAL